ncbi:hypothetical protein [Methylibium sp.]|uniref:hypothetical protein n=1 Tax=Methylibium sp. TaxID=2067992 RepID=UPI003D136C3F
MSKSLLGFLFLALHIPLTSAALALPEMGGSGVVRDLRGAMSLGNAQSAELVSAMQVFIGARIRAPIFYGQPHAGMRTLGSV